MRVISGLRKGHRLIAPKGITVRPTEDKIKESLFNILGYIDEDSIVLDAFGGSGSIGIEFLSRGAKTSYFVDKYIESINTIKENLKHTKLLENSNILKSDIFVALKSFGVNKIKFDYIYLDPPYRKDNLIHKLLESIGFEDVLQEDGMIIIEHESELDLEKVTLSNLAFRSQAEINQDLDYLQIMNKNLSILENLGEEILSQREGNDSEDSSDE